MRGGIEAVEEVAFAEHGQGFIIERELLRGPGAIGLRHETKRLAGRDVVGISAAFEDKCGCKEEDKNCP